MVHLVLAGDLHRSQLFPSIARLAGVDRFDRAEAELRLNYFDRYVSLAISQSLQKIQQPIPVGQASCLPEIKILPA